MGDRRDLAIDRRRGSADRVKTCAFTRVPGGRRLVVRKHWKRSVHDVAQVGLERGAALAGRQSAATVRQFMPHRGRDGALVAVLGEAPDDEGVRGLGDGEDTTLVSRR